MESFLWLKEGRAMHHPPISMGRSWSHRRRSFFLRLWRTLGAPPEANAAAPRPARPAAPVLDRGAVTEPGAAAQRRGGQAPGRRSVGAHEAQRGHAPGGRRPHWGHVFLLFSHMAMAGGGEAEGAERGRKNDRARSAVLVFKGQGGGANWPRASEASEGAALVFFSLWKVGSHLRLVVPP